MAIDDAILKSFWSKVDKSGGSEACWPWLAGKCPQGYGHFWDGERTWRANRFALYCIDPFMTDVSCHSCDRPDCCNPRHLRWDNQQGNVNDMWLRQRRTKNINKFTPEVLSYIRSQPKSYGINRRLAEELQVSVGSIEDVRCGKTYRRL